MNFPTTEMIGNSSIGLAVASGITTGVSSYFGWFDFINKNAPGLGFLVSVFFGVIGVVFYWLSLKKERLSNENNIRIVELEKTVKKLMGKDHKIK